MTGSAGQSGQDRQAALVRAMPAVFVLIWSTGFIVARYGMPHAPPMKFLAMRYFLSVVCFAAWALMARAALPANRRQVGHLAITGILMHAGYLGGVWAAVKLGMGAGLTALLVGLQPVLTAVWVSSWGGSVSSRQWAGLAMGLLGLALVVWQKLGVGEIHALNFSLALMALVSITAGTLYQKRFVTPCDVRTASLVQLCAAFAVTMPLALLETEAMRWNGELAGAMAWSVLALTLGGSSLLYLLIQKGAATAVTSLLYLVPPCTAVMAAILFGEDITAFTIAGMALAAIGVSLVVRSPAPPRAATR
ncbi:MAG: DMT family transporter [Pseudomonadota bacterium]